MPARHGMPEMPQAVEDDEGAARRYRGIDVGLREPHDGRLLKLAQLDELPPLLDQHSAEHHDGQHAEGIGDAPKPGREAVDHELEAEMAGPPDADGRAEE